MTILINESQIMNTVVYHGTDEKHSFDKRGNIYHGTFFSTDKDTAQSFGEYVYQVNLVGGLLLFNTLDIEYINKLYSSFDVLYDTYYSDDEEEYYLRTPESFHDSEDNWESIENTPGVLEWLKKQYDGVWILEGGEKNLLLFTPIKDKILDVKLLNE